MSTSFGRNDKNTEELYDGRLYGEMVEELSDAGMNGIYELLDADVVIERQETSNESNSEDGFVLEYNHRSILPPFREITERETYSRDDVDAEEVKRVCEYHSE